MSALRGIIRFVYMTALSGIIRFVYMAALRGIIRFLYTYVSVERHYYVRLFVRVERPVEY
jgi:hypothetical protein